MKPTLIRRETWGARAPRGRIAVTWAQRTEFFVHHTAGPPAQSTRSIQDFHMDDNDWSDIGYNHLVRDDGTIYEGRGWCRSAAAYQVGTRSTLRRTKVSASASTKSGTRHHWARAHVPRAGGEGALIRTGSR